MLMSNTYSCACSLTSRRWDSGYYVRALTLIDEYSSLNRDTLVTIKHLGYIALRLMRALIPEAIDVICENSRICCIEEGIKYIFRVHLIYIQLDVLLRLSCFSSRAQLIYFTSKLGLPWINGNQCESVSEHNRSKFFAPSFAILCFFGLCTNMY